MIPRVLFAAICLLVFCQPFQTASQEADDTQPATPGLPDGDTDLVEARRAGVLLHTKATALASTPGATYDQEQAEKIAAAAAAMFQTLGLLGDWSDIGYQLLHEKFTSAIYDISITANKLAFAQELLAMRDFAHDFARLMMELADLGESLKKLDKLLSGEGTASKELRAAIANPAVDTATLQRVMPYAESLFVVNFMAKWGGRLTKLTGGLSTGSAAVDRIVSAFFDTLSVANTFLGNFQKLLEVRALGGGWSTVLKVFKITGIGKLLFKPLEMISNHFAKALQERIGELEKEIEGYELSQGQLFDARSRLMYRTDLTRETQQQLFEACVAFDSAVGRANTVLTTPSQPDPAANSYSSAFKVYVPRLVKQTGVLNELLLAFDIGETAPTELSVNAEELKPGEEFTVSWQLPGSAARRAWVGIVPHDIAHGLESAAASRALELKSIPSPGKGETAEGSFTFKAPAQPGLYDVRLCDAEADRELRFICVRVKQAGEGTRLKFGPSLRDQPQKDGVITLPDADPQQHTEFPLEFLVEDSGGKAMAGVRIESAVLDADGKETEQGPMLKGRYEMVSGTDGVIAGIILWGVPEGSWTIRFHSPEVENELKVHVKGASPTARIRAGIKPDTLNTASEKPSGRTAFVYGWIEGLPAPQLDEGYVLRGRVSGPGKLIVPGAKSGPDKDGWQTLDIHMYYFMVTADKDADAASIQATVELLDPEGKAIATHTREIRLVRLDAGMAGLRVTMTAPAGLLPGYSVVAISERDQQEFTIIKSDTTYLLPAGSYRIIARPFLRMDVFKQGVECGRITLQEVRITSMVARPPLGYIEVVGVPARTKTSLEAPALMLPTEDLKDGVTGFPIWEINGIVRWAGCAPPGRYHLAKISWTSPQPVQHEIFKKDVTIRAFELRRIAYPVN